MKFAGFIGPSYTASSVHAGAQRSMNLYPETVEVAGEPNVISLYGTPGLLLFCTLPNTPVRAIWAGGSSIYNAARLFAVGGSHLYEILYDGTMQDRGSVGDDAAHTPATILTNGNQLCIISAGQTYIDNGGVASGANTSLVSFASPIAGTVNTAGINVTWASGDMFDTLTAGSSITIAGTGYTVNQVWSSTFLWVTVGAGALAGAAFSAAPSVQATTGTFLDGYFIVNKPSSKQFNISALNNGASWANLDFGVKQGYPDSLVRVLADHEDLWLFGETTTEVWRNTGTPAFPFERDPGGFIHQGCAAPFSAVNLANGVAWIGGDTRGQPVAWRAQGFIPIRVSTHAVEQLWQQFSTVNDAIAYVYEDQGHQFWVIHFPSGNQTWVYDATNGLWHERGEWDTFVFSRQRGQVHAFIAPSGVNQWSKYHFVGDWQNGKIYKMSTIYYDAAGTAIRRLRSAPHVSDEQRWTFYHRFTLEAEITRQDAGVGFAITLDWSDDNGHTWGTAHTATSGAYLAYAARVIWRRLGKGRNRVFRVSMTAPAKIALIAADLDTSPGKS